MTIKLLYVPGKSTAKDAFQVVLHTRKHSYVLDAYSAEELKGRGLTAEGLQTAFESVADAVGARSRTRITETARSQLDATHPEPAVAVNAASQNFSLYKEKQVRDRTRYHGLAA